MCTSTFFCYEAGLWITLQPNGHTALPESWRKCCLVNRNVYFQWLKSKEHTFSTTLHRKTGSRLMNLLNLPSKAALVSVSLGANGPHSAEVYGVSVTVCELRKMSGELPLLYYPLILLLHLLLRFLVFWLRCPPERPLVSNFLLEMLSTCCICTSPKLQVKVQNKCIHENTNRLFIFNMISLWHEHRK